MSHGSSLGRSWSALHPARATIAIIPGLVTAIVVAAAVFAVRRLDSARGWVDHTNQVLQVTSTLQTRLLEAEGGVRAYVISGDSGFLVPYRGSEREVRANLAQLRTLTSDNALQSPRLALIDTLVTNRFRSLDAGVERRQTRIQADDLPARSALARRQADSLRAMIGAVVGTERQLLRQRSADVDRSAAIATFVIIIGGTLAVVVAFFANGRLSRHVRDLTQANTELEQQAGQLEEQASELEMQASELEMQASELEATAAELEASNVELEEQAVELEEQRDSAQSARAEAEQSNAAKSRFLSVMSHELRTPLNAIVGYVDLMEAEVHGPVTTDQREDIRRIKRAAAQLTSVISDILNFAKLEAGEVQFDLGPVEMHEALMNASALMEPQAAARNVRFDYALCDHNIIACADRERVQQIVLNLLSNAVKYTSAGGDVRLECSEHDGMVLVRITDTGRGIAAADVRRIFEPFVQLTTSTHTPSDGVGLGLAISRDLARGMGGDIVVESTVGTGSMFELSLPLLAVPRGSWNTNGESSHSHWGVTQELRNQ